MDKWLISDIFKNLRKIDLNLAIKFDNVNSIKIVENTLFINVKGSLFMANEIKKLNNILIDRLKMKKINFIFTNENFSLPYPVRNSKFNNFVTIIKLNGEKLYFEFYQKDNKKYFEKIYFQNKNNFLNELKKFVEIKLDLFIDLYRYNQIVLPYLYFKDYIINLVEEWDNFLIHKKINKFVDTLYFKI